MLTDNEAAYLAGFFDGEGCIICSVNQYGNADLRVRLGNTHLETVKWIHSLFGGSLYPRDVPNRKPLLLWAINGSKAKPFLLTIEPFCKIKKSVVSLALEFIKLERGSPEKLVLAPRFAEFNQKVS